MSSGHMKLVMVAAMFLAASAISQSQQGWERSEINDALRKVSYSRFVLQSKYLVAPRNQKAGELPTLVVHCSAEPRSVGYHVFVNGRFLAGYLVTGTIVNSQVTVHEGFLGTSFPVVVSATYRLDEGKLQTDNWKVSTDYTSAFFGSDTLNNFLYGHILPHKEGKGAAVRKIILGLDEASAGEVQIQFDMSDPTPVAEACGVIVHKR
jgi:hypothetical protein